MNPSRLQSSTADTQVDENTELRFAAAYGFRNIQNLVQKLKRGRCKYHFVEIMACPSGKS